MCFCWPLAGAFRRAHCDYYGSMFQLRMRMRGAAAVVIVWVERNFVRRKKHGPIFIFRVDLQSAWAARLKSSRNHACIEQHLVILTQLITSSYISLSLGRTTCIHTQLLSRTVLNNASHSLPAAIARSYSIVELLQSLHKLQTLNYQQQSPALYDFHARDSSQESRTRSVGTNTESVRADDVVMEYFFP